MITELLDLILSKVLPYTAYLKNSKIEQKAEDKMVLGILCT